MAVHQETASARAADAPPRASFFYDPKVRGLVYQVALSIALAAFIYWIVQNTMTNLQRANIAAGFGFWNQRAGFAIGQTLIDYTPNSSYGRAFFVGLLNTLQVAVIGVFLASILGFLIGIARLSPNWLIRKIAMVYVEVMRNVPLLLQLLLWYKAVLSVLPGPRDAIDLPFGAWVSNRGLNMPAPVFETGSTATVTVFLIALAAVIGLRRWSLRRQMASGQTFPFFRVATVILVGLPLVVFLASGMPITFTYPELAGFNFRGGMEVRPEFLALLLGLVIYTAAFIAEIVRAGIMAVSHGQTEAAFSLGLRPGKTLRLVVIPQALRVIIPPLTSQYLNLTKNSSLAVAVGYPDLVSVFAGTVLNQTGQAVEMIGITMLVYLTLSLLTSGFMNWFNSRMALVER